MNFDELLVAIESLLVGKFKFFPIEEDNLFRELERHTIKTANGNVSIYGTTRICFEGNGHYIDNMDMSADFVGAYDFVVKNMYVHKIKYDAKVLQMREAVGTLQELNCVNAAFVEKFDTITPTISVELDGLQLFTLVLKFRKVYVEFEEDFSLNDILDDYNGYDMPVSVVAKKGIKLPSGLHVFERNGEVEKVPFGLRAFLTPCTIHARTITVKKVIQNEHSNHPFYEKLLDTQTVKVVEYWVP